MFDMRSILLSMTVMQAIMAAVLAAFWTVRSDANGLKEMALAAVFGTIGTLIGGAGAGSRDFRLVTLGTAVIMLGILAAARSMARLQRRRPRYRLEMAAFVAGVSAIAYFALARHNVAGIFTSISAVFALVSGVTARDLFRETDPALKTGCRGLAMLFALCCGLHALRVGFRPFIEGVPGPGGQIVLLDVVYVFVSLAIMIGWCLGLLWAIYNSAEFHLRAAYDELDRFSGMVAHDLKSPLTAVIGNIETVLYSPKLDATRKEEFLANAREGALRMNRFINALLEHARSAKAVPTPEAVDPDSCLRAARANLQPLIHAVGADLEVSPLPQVRATSLQLTRVFQNLLDNALKYRAPDRPLRIEIDAELNGDHVRIRFRDNGIGIAKADHARVFNRFERAGKTTLVQGDGVGLSECRRILESYGGSIEVDSELGAGATFVIVLAAV